MSETPFPADFLWGVATSGHQTEGDNTESDTWFLEHVIPSVFREPSGKATNGWDLWETDLDLVGAMNLNAYRFSIEWARVEPRKGQFSEEALSHYEALLDGCRARGLVPIVTFNHFTSPHWFAAKGSWLNPDAPRLFARYCSLLVERFGDRIGVAVTFNEPNLLEMLEWADLPPLFAEIQKDTLLAASKAAGVERYRAANVMLPEDFPGMNAGIAAAHLAGKAEIKRRRPGLPVGLSIAMCDDIAAPGGEELRDRKRAAAYDPWLHLARNDDFIGVQNYEQLVYGPGGSLPPAHGSILNGGGTAVAPESLRGAVDYAFGVSQVAVLVTEHGISTPDDALRSVFIGASLEGLAQAISQGAPVMGYCHWTLMDDFEWVFGYGPRLGLHEVDRATFERTPKASADVYADLVKRFRQA